MSEFFVRRPIVAIVIAILMTLIGGVCILALPIAQYPQIAPPEIQVQTHYTGADALTIEQSVAAPIEQQMSGVDNMNYMYSINANSGDIRLIVNFDVATDPNIDHVLTQLRVSQAQSQLPADVNNYGVTVKKSTTAPLMLIALYSPKGSYDGIFLANYGYINLFDQLTRVPGIGNVQIFGAGQYAMRLWVKPDQLAKLGITVPDIITAVQKQNTVNPAGQVGGEPIPSGQKFTYTVRAQGRLQTPEEFGEIVVRANPDGSFVRVKDIARIESRRADLQLEEPVERTAVGNSRSLSTAGNQRGQSRARCAQANGGSEAAVSGRHRLRRLARSNTLRHRRHARNREDAVRSARARCARRFHFSAGLARNADSTVRGAGLVGRHVCAVSAVWILDQHALTFRSRARDRSRGR